MTTKTLPASAFVALLSSDLAAMREAVMKNAWPEVTVFANRFASDAALFKDADPQFTARFLGLVLRIVAEDSAQAYGRLRTFGSPTDPLVDTITTYLGNTAEHLPQMDADFSFLCSSYYHFEKQVGSYQQSPSEQVAYQSAKSLEGAPRDVLSDFVLQNADVIKRPSTIPVEGVLNELSRICRVFPFDEIDLCFFTGLKSFSLLNAYYQFLLSLPDGARPLSPEEVGSEKENWTRSLLTFVGKLRDSTPKDAWSLTRATSGPMLQRWRELFLLNMEPPTLVVRQEAPAKAPTPSEKKTRSGRKATE